MRRKTIRRDKKFTLTKKKKKKKKRMMVWRRKVQKKMKMKGLGMASGGSNRLNLVKRRWEQSEGMLLER